MSLMLAAKAAGLETPPMDGFDLGRLKRPNPFPRFGTL